MADRDPLADLFAGHAPHVGPITGAWRCPSPCGASSSVRQPDGYDSSREQRAAEHRTHLAAAVHAFLASDETVERAAEGITDAHWCESNYTRGCNCHEYRVSEARAALAAATEVRP